MQESDTFASLIAFLFVQDRKTHPAPVDLIEKILRDAKNKEQAQAKHKERERKWHKR